MNDQIWVNLTESASVTLNSNSPDIDALVSKVVENKDIIDPDSIEIKCDNSDFDCAGFKEIVAKAVKGFLHDIQIEENMLDAELRRIRSHS